MLREVSVSRFLYPYLQRQFAKSSPISTNVYSASKLGNSSAFVLLIVAIKRMNAYCANRHHVNNGREEETTDVGTVLEAQSKQVTVTSPHCRGRSSFVKSDHGAHCDFRSFYDSDQRQVDINLDVPKVVASDDSPTGAACSRTSSSTPPQGKT